MAGIYKYGVPWGTDYDTAIAEKVAVVEAQDPDPVYEKGVFWTTDHEAAGEYLVKIVTRAV